MRLELIIFDCDGVLVDSESISNKIFANMLNKININISTEETSKIFKGRSMITCKKLIKKKYGVELSDDFVFKFRQRAFQKFKKELQPIPGIKYALNNIKNRICVASSGLREKMDITLKVTGLYKYFKGKIFSVSEVTRGKPYPDIFIYAAQKMGVEPKRCLVVEDSDVGVKAAISAQMHVIKFSKLNKNSKKLSNKIINFENMYRLPALIKQIEKDLKD